MAKQIWIKPTTEGNVQTISEFAKNVAIDKVSFNDEKRYIQIDYKDKYQNEKREFLGESQFIGTKEKPKNFKTVESKNAVLAYMGRQIFNLFKCINPLIEEVDSLDIKELYEAYNSQSEAYLPTDFDGELKLVYQTKEGEYGNLRPSFNLPNFSNSRNPQKLAFIPMEIKDGANGQYTTGDLVTFTKIVPTPDVETPITPPTPTTPTGSDDVPF